MKTGLIYQEERRLVRDPWTPVHSGLADNLVWKISKLIADYRDSCPELGEPGIVMAHCKGEHLGQMYDGDVGTKSRRPSCLALVDI